MLGISIHLIALVMPLLVTSSRRGSALILTTHLPQVDSTHDRYLYTTQPSKRKCKPLEVDHQTPS